MFQHNSTKIWKYQGNSIFYTLLGMPKYQTKMIPGYVSPRQAEGRSSRINFIEPNYSPGMYKTLAELDYCIRLVCFDCSKWLIPLTKGQILQLTTYFGNFFWMQLHEVI